ncbi:MAG: isoamylase [Candidatus Binatia bacterium]
MSERWGPLRSVNAWEASEGAPWPLGATWVESHAAWNFALFSRHATGVTLLLYAADDPATPVHTVRLDPLVNKTAHIWHCWVRASAAGGATLYGYRVEGPVGPGHRFDAEKILLDPFAEAVFFPPRFSRAAAARPGPTDGRAPLGRLPGRTPAFDWGADPRPRHSHDLIVYELHVRGFSARPSSGVAPEKRGTFAGLVEKLPYLRELGVTAVELLPVHQYDPQEGNYWGYMTLDFFAPHRGYASGDPAVEFRQMVKAFHAAGIEVWLDVVYNHTTEGPADGPTYNFRGIDNRSYYLLGPDGAYRNYSGCGNTLRCAHPAVQGLVLESLRRWVEDMHVDGFRFDLASILARGPDGTLSREPALIREIAQLAYRADVRVVAEAWDIDAYLLGQGFPGLTWRQWNGKFRDDVRAFVRGDRGRVGALMARLYGSDDLFPEREAYRPYQSVNFVTAHDGFCLHDLVTYDRSRAGDTSSWNHGWEGDEDAPAAVLALRRRQVRTFFCLLMLANGTPMFCAGDEFLNTQGGNANPYDQDNETTWLDWDLLERNRDVFRFFRLMIAFRKAHPTIARSRFWRGDVRWYGVGPDVDLAADSHSLAYCLRGARLEDDDLYVMINAWQAPLEFVVQEGQAGDWLRVVDTGLVAPDDIAEPGRETLLDGLAYRVEAGSVVVLRRPWARQMGR